ncbi:neutral/alkaline non-lysosomal ceramidase N-terminal domain-containing protein [Litchfieldia alkalitelluris]|uniref:neutral/alkaline non-lysosomal ceramidase N-terminal domain-containing protein n=1 Tax=Litchfieldia alkalitelluris TaxID=304268 RepID=UPI0009963FB8|nr:neutral/alkaline non-lysosomal ceramidase N-terminal domain-containing protein [Litchfieldia alkalitelluris]
MKSALKVGVGKMTITPEHPVPLAGFKERKNPFEGISHPLHLRVLFFQLEELGKVNRSILVSADLIWWDTNRTKKLHKRIAEKWGLAESAIILHATHTHSGPQTSDQFTPSLGSLDYGYLDFLEEQLMIGLEQAYQNLESVTIMHGVGKCEIGIHRRKLLNGKVVMAPNPDGPSDSEVNVIKFQTKTKRTKALITHYACHPTTTGDNYVSSEYPGVAMDIVEQYHKGETVAIFLQGCSGDIRPFLMNTGIFFRGTDAEVRKLGKLLADQIISVVSKPMNFVEPKMKSENFRILLPFKDLPSLEELKSKIKEEDVIGEWSSLLVGNPNRVRTTIPVECTYLQLSDSLAFLGMNAEVVVEYGIWIKMISSGKVLPIPYSNGMIGYIPTARQLVEGGYEAEESIFYFGLPGPFSPSIENEIKKSIRKQLGGNILDQTAYQNEEN